ncbi:c-type cytochrome [Owenweeksia hongkongensis]|uniref:c-type cytochrome n=1 Tax=Owenweeksia hongkongensis TaxID=253245 RepID=UPI003A952A8B
MKNAWFNFSLFLLLSLALSQCDINQETNSLKVAASDPFKESIVPSQNFEITGIMDTVLQGLNGTMIVIPKGAFMDSYGNTIIGEIKIELAEALSLDEMIFSNLTTQSNGQPLETDGMIYIDAISNGEHLRINPKNPIYIEIPTKEKIPGMMAYKGIRDSEGNMNWVDPQPIENYLVTVDINLLDFYPNGFEDEIVKGLPFRKHDTLTKNLSDSLYYSLSVYKLGDLPEIAEEIIMNEPYYNKQSKVVNGKYTEQSYYQYYNAKTQQVEVGFDTSKAKCCGIDPAMIKVLKSGKYDSTLIATREFQTRLQSIFETCENEILEVYVNNIGLDLYKLDSMAAYKLRAHKMAKTFENYSHDKLTNVRNANKYVRLLRGYYGKELSKTKKELEKLRRKALKQLDRESKAFEKVAGDYRKLLFKREKHRMQKYGFEWASTGWINIDKGTQPKTWFAQPLEVKLDSKVEFDRVYCYAVYTSIKSIYRLNTDDGETFYVGNGDDKEMLMPNNGFGELIGIGYLGDKTYFARETFIPGKDIFLNLKWEGKNMNDIKDEIREFEKFGKENRISKDLEYMAIFEKEKQRQQKLVEEKKFIETLHDIAFPCCPINPDGKILYEENCSSCHKINQKLIGPALHDVTAKHDIAWLLAFTRNNEKLRAEGNLAAQAIFEEYNGSVMPRFDLTNSEIEAIYDYIDGYNSVNL